MTKEIEWKGKPSQLLNLGVFLSSIFIVTLPLVFIRWKNLKETIYEISKSQVCFKSSFIEQRTECIPLNDITNISIEKPLFLRLFSLSNLIFTSSDNRKIIFAGMRSPEDIIRQLKKNNKSVEI